MTKIIGLTGGIGSGKSTVAKYFSDLGVPVYIADDAAKDILEKKEFIEKITSVFGADVFENGQINRRTLASIVFNDQAKLQLLNSIVHPAVREDFNEWLNQQHVPFVIKEAAILFETGSYTQCDAIITVTAPVEDRIKRLLLRDNISREEVLARMDKQWPDEKKVAMSNFVITNVNHLKTQQQVAEIFNLINNSII
ncbi:MAG TPA: dephospho-CoA kinase [Flavobacterium sp.]|jgi:dephospho-CoA kinase